MSSTNTPPGLRGQYPHAGSRSISHSPYDDSGREGRVLVRAVPYVLSLMFILTDSGVLENVTVGRLLVVRMPLRKGFTPN